MNENIEDLNIRVCIVCDQNNETEDFEEGGDVCKDCSSDRMFFDSPFQTSTAKTRLWNKRLDQTLARKEFMTAQNGCCAICGMSEEESKKSLNLDHDHETLVIRGLLCFRCNLVLGSVEDSPHILREAIKYLEASGV